MAKYSQEEKEELKKKAVDLFDIIIKNIKNKNIISINVVPFSAIKELISIFKILNIISINFEDIRDILLYAKKNKLDYDNFIKYLKRLPTNDYEIYIPIYKLFDNTKSFNTIINGNKIEIISYRQILEFIKELKIKDYPKRFFHVTIKSYSLRKGWIDEVGDTFELFKGIIDYHLSKFNSINLSLGFNVNNNRSAFQHPNWLIIYLKDKPYKFPFQLDITKKIPTTIISKKNISKIKQTFRIFKDKIENKSIIDLLRKSLTIYTQALDTEYDTDCFLHLWQLIECITLGTNDQGKTDTIIKRLKNYLVFVHYRDFNILETVKLLADKRNELVHSGSSDIDDMDIFVIRNICEYGIHWLFENKSIIKDEDELEIYYKNINLKDGNIDKLKKQVKIINHIKNIKR